MLYPLLLTLTALWLIDLYQTLAITKKYGIKSEENPLARFLLKQNPKDFTIFKIIDLAFISAIFIFSLQEQKTLSNLLLIAFNLIYIFTVTHNHNIIKRHRKATENI